MQGAEALQARLSPRPPAHASSILSFRPVDPVCPRRRRREGDARRPGVDLGRRCMQPAAAAAWWLPWQAPCRCVRRLAAACCGRSRSGRGLDLPGRRRAFRALGAAALEQADVVPRGAWRRFGRLRPRDEAHARGGRRWRPWGAGRPSDRRHLAPGGRSGRFWPRPQVSLFSGWPRECAFRLGPPLVNKNGCYLYSFPTLTETRATHRRPQSSRETSRSREGPDHRPDVQLIPEHSWTLRRFC